MTGGDFSQWKDEPFQGKPITSYFWSRRSPPPSHLDPNNLTQTGVAALLANEGADCGPWAGIRLHGSAGRTAAGTNRSNWRRGRAWRGFVGALTVFCGGGRRGQSGARPMGEARAPQPRQSGGGRSQWQAAAAAAGRARRGRREARRPSLRLAEEAVGGSGGGGAGARGGGGGGEAGEGRRGARRLSSLSAPAPRRLGSRAPPAPTVPRPAGSLVPGRLSARPAGLGAAAPVPPHQAPPAPRAFPGPPHAPGPAPHARCLRRSREPQAFPGSRPRPQFLPGPPPPPPAGNPACTPGSVLAASPRSSRDPQDFPGLAASPRP